MVTQEFFRYDYLDMPTAFNIFSIRGLDFHVEFCSFSSMELILSVTALVEVILFY